MNVSVTYKEYIEYKIQAMTESIFWMRRHLCLDRTFFGATFLVKSVNRLKIGGLYYGLFRKLTGGGWPI